MNIFKKIFDLIKNFCNYEAPVREAWQSLLFLSLRGFPEGKPWQSRLWERIEIATPECLRIQARNDKRTNSKVCHCEAFQRKAVAISSPLSLLAWVKVSKTEKR
jgi:hypothetical protein